MQTVTLAAEDFRTIHNTLCDLRGLAQRMGHSMVKTEEVEQIIERLEQGLADAYSQDDVIFDRKMDYFQEFKQRNEFESIWSLYELEVGCFEQAHPYLPNSVVVYCGREVPVLGATWHDVYRAADTAIRSSDDTHHCFIEGFRIRGNQLHMFTGS